MKANTHGVEAEQVTWGDAYQFDKVCNISMVAKISGTKLENQVGMLRRRQTLMNRDLRR